MAGIGFRLQKLLDDESYSSQLRAFAYSAMIAAGPFLVTVFSVVAIHVFSFATLTRYESAYLQSIVTYGFCFSLIAVGASYLVLTRYVADEYYKGHTASFTATYFSALAVNAVVWGPAVILYCARLSQGWGVQVLAFMLGMVTLFIWLSLLFLSAARDFIRITRCFSAGCLFGVVFAYFAGPRVGLAGYLGGFVLGQTVIFLLLTRALMKEFGYHGARDYYWLRYFKKHPAMMAIGLLYNIGIWADKICFWASAEGRSLDVGLRYCPIYDAPMFFAYLSIVPSLAYFLIRMETDFFLKYHAYYQGIEHQEDQDQLQRRRQDILFSLTDNVRRMLLIQAVVSLLALTAVPGVVHVARMDPLQMGVLRVGIYAAFLQAGFLIALNLLLYFDYQAGALYSALVFCGSNVLLTAVTLPLGLALYGYGYAAACFLGLVTAAVFLNRRLEKLHFWTFMTQPIPKPMVIQEEF